MQFQSFERRANTLDGNQLTVSFTYHSSSLCWLLKHPFPLLSPEFWAKSINNFSTTLLGLEYFRQLFKSKNLLTWWMVEQHI